MPAAGEAAERRVRAVRATGRGVGALGGVVAGSGPPVGVLVADTGRGLDLAVALTASGAAPAVIRAVGPVHGAHVITGPAGPRGS